MTDPPWWRNAVIYQIYPRSFQDSDGDGVGDLAGIVRRLDHVAGLGVDAVALAPVFPSPMADTGYDVSDHRGIDPVFGSLSGFDALLDRAHGLGLKVVIDQVLSRSSDKHPFFATSRASRDNPKADWYVWAEPKLDGTPPNNWQAVFGGPAWRWEPRRRQYYLANFRPSQPALNFHHPAVRDWVLDTLCFWLDRGVDGFRLDSWNFTFHDVQLRDNPAESRSVPWPAGQPFQMQHQLFQKNQPEALAFSETVRAMLDGYPGERALVAEINEFHHPVARLAEYIAPGRLHMGFHPGFLGPTFTPAFVRDQIRTFRDAAPGACACWAFSNHDVDRHLTRWAGHAIDDDRFAILCAALLLSLEGTVSLYQGEELGLRSAVLTREELRDPDGLGHWPQGAGRDGARTPMPWEAHAPHAGFTEGTPWLPVKPPEAARAVDTQAGVPGSVLERYRRLIALRRDLPALRHGATRVLAAPAPILVLGRGEDVLCVFNLGPKPAAAPLPDGDWTPRDGTVAGAQAGRIALDGNGWAILSR
ncbi:alpha-glucosidase [Jannaschia ovalis]|uniref:Alpha glucosidase n=1 Tax=Jannaschia ovalis TaxID=3038773 RepID=A0ABY8L883_9RHOB|nr:alpha glucosidase [Jannaschia sp. GRR-S6-38]WGH77572.1 alpha glucosidase [Jannaschia sp. GRR-S6-38]